MALIKKKPFKPNEKLRKKPCVLIGEKPLKFDKKTRKKIKSSIDEKLLKLNEETSRKPIIRCFVKDEKSLKPS